MYSLYTIFIGILTYWIFFRKRAQHVMIKIEERVQVRTSSGTR
jgi:hypothetical protein